MGSNLNAVSLAPSYYLGALINHVSCMQPSLEIVNEHVGIVTCPFDLIVILCRGSLSAATQLTVIPSCGPSSLRNAFVTRVDSSGDALLGRRLAWATSCFGDVLLCVDFDFDLLSITPGRYTSPPVLS